KEQRGGLRWPAIAAFVVAARVVKGKDRLDQEPRGDQRDYGQRKVPGPGPEREPLEAAPHVTDRHDAEPCGTDDDEKDDVAARVLHTRMIAGHFRGAERDEAPGKSKVDDGAEIPTRNQARAPRNGGGLGHDYAAPREPRQSHA